MVRWAWLQLEPWMLFPRQPPIGAQFCVIRGATAGRAGVVVGSSSTGAYAAGAGVLRRCAPHQLRHAQALEMTHKRVPLVVIQRQLGHANLA
jgi:integrase